MIRPIRPCPGCSSPPSRTFEYDYPGRHVTMHYCAICHRSYSPGPRPRATPARPHGPHLPRGAAALAAFAAGHYVPRSEHLPKRFRQVVLERDAGRCQLGCEQAATTVDHIVPVARGGTHHIDNLRASCGPCNFRRGAITAANGQRHPSPHELDDREQTLVVILDLLAVPCDAGRRTALRMLRAAGHRVPGSAAIDRACAWRREQPHRRFSGPQLALDEVGEP